MHLPGRQAGKDSPGHLSIEINEEKNILHCVITDNGVGREKAEAFKANLPKKKNQWG